MQAAAKRRRAQAKMGFTHLCKAKRPNYKKGQLDIHAAIAAERRRAARIAAASSKKK
jgi:hypothetical protein